MGSNKVESCALENICNIFQTSPPNVQVRLLLWMFDVTSCTSNTSIAILLRSNSVSCGVPQHRQTRFAVLAIAMSLSTTLWSVQEHTVDCTDTYGVVFTVSAVQTTHSPQRIWTQLGSCLFGMFAIDGRVPRGPFRRLGDEFTGKDSEATRFPLSVAASSDVLVVVACGQPWIAVSRVVWSTIWRAPSTNSHSAPHGGVRVTRMVATAFGNWYPSLSASGMVANALRTATFMNVSAASYVFLKFLAKDLLNFPSAPHPSGVEGRWQCSPLAVLLWRPRLGTTTWCSCRAESLSDNFSDGVWSYSVF